MREREIADFVNPWRFENQFLNHSIETGSNAAAPIQTASFSSPAGRIPSFSSSS